jgi:peptide/nickel transport system ATP-binding protein
MDVSSTSASGLDRPAVTSERLLTVRGLKVQFATRDGVVPAVDGVDFQVDRGQVLAIVGESGSGKSATALTLLGLTRTRGSHTQIEGTVEFKGTNLLALSERGLRSIRGRQISMIFQDPMSSLNPLLTVGDQIAEAIRAHERASRAAARARAKELLEQVGIAHAQERLSDYPHRFSGGMRQRVMIAMAIACHPDILIADEPTTALDVTIQAQIFELLVQIRREFNSSVILITHDLSLAAQVADEVIVMYGGRVVEQGSIAQVFSEPQHPYTLGLIGSIPRVDLPRPERLYSIPGTPPTVLKPVEGCRFRPRCPCAFERCLEEPELVARGADHPDRCWLSAQEKRDRRLGAIASGGVQ